MFQIASANRYQELHTHLIKNILLFTLLFLVIFFTTQVTISQFASIVSRLRDQILRGRTESERERGREKERIHFTCETSGWDTVLGMTMPGKANMVPRFRRFSYSLALQQISIMKLNLQFNTFYCKF